MNITNEQWQTLKAYIADDLKMCLAQEMAHKKEGKESRAKEWFMAAETERQILSEMNAIEKKSD